MILINHVYQSITLSSYLIFYTKRPNLICVCLFVICLYVRSCVVVFIVFRALIFIEVPC